MELLFRWEVTSVVVVFLVGIGLAVLALNDFKRAKLFFLLSAADAIGGTAMAIDKSGIPSWAMGITAFLGCGLIGLMLLASFRYVDRKEAEKRTTSPPAPTDPELEGRFSFVATTPRTGVQDSQVLIDFFIKNTGAPSVVDHIILMAHSVSGRTVMGDFIQPHDVRMEKDGQQVSATADQFLTRKVNENPIGTNAGVAGVLEFLLKGMPYNELVQAGSTLTLHFADALGRQYSALFTYTGKDDRFPEVESKASTSEIAKELAQELKSQEGRHLTEKQKEALHKFGNQIPEGVYFYVYAVSSSVEAQTYAREIWGAIGAKGKNGRYTVWGADIQPMPTGLIITSMSGSPDNLAYRTNAGLAITLLENGIPSVSKQGYAPMDNNPNTVTLVVGIKPPYN